MSENISAPPSVALSSSVAPSPFVTPSPSAAPLPSRESVLLAEANTPGKVFKPRLYFGGRKLAKIEGFYNPCPLVIGGINVVIAAYENGDREITLSDPRNAMTCWKSVTLPPLSFLDLLKAFAGKPHTTKIKWTEIIPGVYVGSTRIRYFHPTIFIGDWNAAEKRFTSVFAKIVMESLPHETSIACALDTLWLIRAHANAQREADRQEALSRSAMSTSTIQATLASKC